MPPWHQLSLDAVEAALKVDRATGLTAPAAEERLRCHGPNRITAPPGKPAWRRLADQVAQPLVLVLLAAGLVTALLGEWPDASVIFGVVAVNAALGYWQEAKAADALAALAQSLSTPVVVRRDGHRRRIDAGDLVPGDVVLLAAGDRVPADLRLFQHKELQTDESMLTGESLPTAKHTAALAADTGLADRSNMAYAGTTVVAGQGAGFVVATGDASETGRIAGLIAAAPEMTTPLTRKMAVFSRWLLWVVGGLALFTFAVGLGRGEAPYAMFMAAVALAVGAIPEGLPAALTITLAIGVSRMARRRAIIRRLAAVETLGGATVICSDKTGTLTQNAMTARAIWCGGQRFDIGGNGYEAAGSIASDGAPAEIGGGLRESLLVGALCNDAGLAAAGRHWKITGDPTEAALLVAAHKGGLAYGTLRSVFPRLDELPFNAQRQFMATLHRVEDETLIYVKGAVERLLPRCDGMLGADGHPLPLDPGAVEAAAHHLADQGLRVLALARGSGSGAALDGDRLADLTLVGLVGLVDPPRPQAVAAVRTCHEAGIRVKMITGDHAVTAAAIARQLHINAGRVLTGRDLGRMGEADLVAAAQSVDVFARVEPEQKLRLVRALQGRGEVVAMTGDGVNDAPALKQADIGIAMGAGGTEVAKEAAAMVLTDDNFASIVAAVEEGRGVWDNLVKFITWTLPTNFGEGLVIVAAVVGGVTLPITPLQILWINMTTAVLLGLTLAFEPVERGVMLRPPRPPAAAVLDAGLIRRIGLVSLLLLGGAFGLFLRHLEQGHSLAEARTVAVNVFVLVETFYLFNCRSLTRRFWSLGLFSNPWLWAGVGLMLGLQLLLTYWPPCHAVFKTAPIDLAAWLEILAVAWIASLFIGGEKYLSRRLGQS